MKLEVLRDRFTAAVERAERVTGKNLTLPVLRCIILSASKGSLVVKATNLDLGYSSTITIKSSDDGDIAVPGSVLHSFLQNLSGDRVVSFEVKDSTLHLSTPHNSTYIKSFPHEDFPEIPHPTTETSVKLDPKEFARGLRAVWYSAAATAMKPELSSVCVFADEEGVVCAATDSYRLAEKRIRMRGVKEFEPLLIPAKNIPEIIRILEGVDDEISMVVGKGQVAFVHQGFYLTSRLVDGVFPDYKQIIPKEFTSEVIMLKQDLVNALKLSSVFSDKFNQVKLTVVQGKDVCEVRTKNADVGEHSQTLPATASGEQLEMTFNSRYLSDCLQSIHGDSLSLQLNGANRPIVVRGVGDKTFLYLLMPLVVPTSRSQ